MDGPTPGALIQELLEMGDVLNNWEASYVISMQGDLKHYGSLTGPKVQRLMSMHTAAVAMRSRGKTQVPNTPTGEQQHQYWVGELAHVRQCISERREDGLDVPQNFYEKEQRLMKITGAK